LRSLERAAGLESTDDLSAYELDTTEAFYALQGHLAASFFDRLCQVPLEADMGVPFHLVGGSLAGGEESHQSGPPEGLGQQIAGRAFIERRGLCLPFLREDYEDLGWRVSLLESNDSSCGRPPGSTTGFRSRPPLTSRAQLWVRLSGRGRFLRFVASRSSV
jgi:hypothetical protein